MYKLSFGKTPPWVLARHLIKLTVCLRIRFVKRNNNVAEKNTHSCEAASSSPAAVKTNIPRRHSVLEEDRVSAQIRKKVTKTNACTTLQMIRAILLIKESNKRSASKWVKIASMYTHVLPSIIEVYRAAILMMSTIMCTVLSGAEERFAEERPG